MSCPDVNDQQVVHLNHHQQPLRQCVLSALEDYFARMGNHDPGDIYRMVMSEVEQPLLETVLQRTGGNQTRAAEILGINRATLRKKLRLYDLA